MERRETNEQFSLSRRNFLTGAAATGALAAASAMFGCAPTYTEEEKGGSAGSADGAAETAKAELPGAQPIAPVDPPEAWDMEADVVVVGLGGGGIIASLIAAEAGKSVIAIDKLDSVGGTTIHSSVFVCQGGSYLQDEAEFSSVGWPFDPDALVAAQIGTYDYQVDYRLLRKLAVAGGETINYMGEHGVDWAFDPHAAKTGHYHRSVCDIHPRPLGMAPVIEPLWAKAEELGVTALLSTNASALIRDGERVVGVQVTNGKGEITNIRGKMAVLLTAGGFAHNFDMLEKYCPSGAQCASAYTMPCDTGECIRMALGCGADMCGYNSLTVFDGGIADYEQGTGPWHHYLYSGDNQLSRQPWLGINKFGERYIYRSGDSTNARYVLALSQQGAVNVGLPDGRGFVFFDDDYEENIWKLDQQGCRQPIIPETPGIDRMPETLAPHDWTVGVADAIERGAIKKADTIEEVAELLELDPEMVAKAVEDWNAMCEKGVDEDLGFDPRFLIPIKKAPFYGIRIGAQLAATQAGVLVNDRMQVISTDGYVIPGLYAGWHTAGGACGLGKTGNTIVGNSGLSWTGGYIAANAILAEEA